MACHRSSWLLLLLTYSCTPAAAQTQPTAAIPDVNAALAATTDVWGELAMRQPNGPSYGFFENLLPPLRYVNTDFRHYPIALAAPLAPIKSRMISNGSGVNVSAGPKVKTWRGFPLEVSFGVGEESEPYGSEPSRLHGPGYQGGYLPIVQTEYDTGDATIAQEDFVPTDAPLADHAALLVRFSLRRGGRPVRLTLSLRGPGAFSAADRFWVDDAGRALLWLGDEWTSNGDSKRVSATLSADRPLLLAVFAAPLESPASLGPLDDARYQALKKNCLTRWQQIIDRCANIDVPEERVNRAWKATTIANLMMASGDQMSYSAGNVYQRLYEAESGDALRTLLIYGLGDTAKQLTDPLLKYVQKGLGFHDAAFRLQMLAHVYWITRDAEFVRSRRALWRPSVDHILTQREPDSGLLPKENYCGDIHTQVYSLNSNANCWRGLRDIAAVLRDLGDTDEAAQIFTAAAEFRGKITAAIEKSIRRDIKPVFLPIGLLGSEQPYEKLTATEMGSYWDLMIPYVLGSEILDDDLTDSVLDYLHTRGGVAMGMIRFDQHSGLFANENGLDDLYGLRYTQTLLRRDMPDRAIVSFYGKLAQGFTRDTFVGGEGSSLLPLDRYGRPMYLPPNSAGNAFFLNTLRELLIGDEDADADDAPDGLRLLFATPRPWLDDGKTIRIERAPTAFGPVSLVAHSDLSHGKVTVDVIPPPRKPGRIRLRVRVPDGWKVSAATVGGASLPLIGNSTADLPTDQKPIKVEFKVTRVP